MRLQETAGLAVVLLSNRLLMSIFNRPRERVLAVSLGLAIMWAPAAFAQPKARPGLPNAFVKTYKLDDVVAARSRGNPSQRSTVIVTLAEGAELPAQFQRFAHAG